jgi:hypothetical protein
MWAANAPAAERTWRTLDQLTDAEKQIIDTTPVPPRKPEQSYLPEEPYPFSAPYNAEEVGYRVMNFTHMARWSHIMADVFGSITKSGYMSQSTMSGLASYKGKPGPEFQINAEPGDVYSDQLFYYNYPPKNEGEQMMWNLRRTGPEQATKLDYFIYSPSLRRVRRQPPPRRENQFPDSVQSFDDVVGREPWEFTWRFIGADTIYESVRFPKNRPTMTLTKPDGSFFEVNTADLKMLGSEYPSYREDGGVECFVVVAEPQRDWLPDYGVSKLVYWVDKTYFYPLRIEQYDSDGKFTTVQVRFAQRENSALPDGEGYTNNQSVYWDSKLDLTAFSVHDAHKVKGWSEEEQTFFTPDFMRRRWETHPRKSLALVDKPEQFYLRPHLYLERFPSERKIDIPADVASRIAAQDASGQLVFADEE